MSTKTIRIYMEDIRALGHRDEQSREKYIKKVLIREGFNLDRTYQRIDDHAKGFYEFRQPLAVCEPRNNKMVERGLS